MHICSSSEYGAESRIPIINNPDEKTIYLVPASYQPSNNMFTEWVYINNTWEIFGSVAVDLSNYLTDVQVDDVSVVTNGIANIPVAGRNVLGVASIRTEYGISILNKSLCISQASQRQCKSGDAAIGYNPITPQNQHWATFYGLAKVAGDTTQSQSSNAVGTYTDDAKTAIQNMLDVPSNSDVTSLQTSIQAKADTSTVTELSGTVSGLQTAVQSKANTQTVTALSGTVTGLQTDVQGLSDAVDGIGNLADLTTEAKTDIVSAINEINAKGGTDITVDERISPTSTNPVQNRAISIQLANVGVAIGRKADAATVSALADAVQGLDGDVQGLQTAVQSKADAQTVTALSGTVTDLQTSKADKTYVDVQLDGKASTQTVSDLVDDVYDIYPTDTASGVIANFPDGANSVPVKSLSVAIEPVQDLHGYDHPWPAGGGVNKADLTGAIAYNDGTYGMYVTIDGEEITLAGTWSNTNPSGIWRFLRVPNIPSDLNVVAFESTSGNHVSEIRQDGTNNRLIITAKNMVTGQAYTIKFKIVAYEGSTAPTAWTPYSNICPITGWTGANVQRTGKNLWDEEWEVGAYSGTTGEKITNTTNMRCKNAIPVKPNTAYYCKSPYAMYVFEYSADGTYLGYTTILNNTMTTKANSCYMRFYLLAVYGTTYNNDISINYPSTITAYEPYHADTYPITFPSEAGTVYGGTLDVVNGVLTVDRAMVDLGTLDWRYFQNGRQTKYYFRSSNEITNAKLSSGNIPNCISDRYKASSWSITVDNAASDNCITFGWSGKSYIAVSDSAYSDASAFKTAMSGVQLVYELATPITYQLTPQEVSTLLGQNNIWADAGDTTVEYRANTSAYIAKKIAEAISTSVQTIEITETDPVITALANTRYVCGEVTSLDFTPAASGICDIIFTAGTTLPVITLPATVKMPEWFEV